LQSIISPCGLASLAALAKKRADLQFPLRIAATQLLNKRISIAEERCFTSLCSYFAVAIVVTVASVFASGVTGIFILNIGDTGCHRRHIRQS